MKATVVKRNGQWNVQIQHRHQYFHLDYYTKKSECKWMAKQFMTALRKHDKEKVKRRTK